MEVVINLILEVVAEDILGEEDFPADHQEIGQKQEEENNKQFQGLVEDQVLHLAEVGFHL